MIAESQILEMLEGIYQEALVSYGGNVQAQGISKQEEELLSVLYPVNEGVVTMKKPLEKEYDFYLDIRAELEREHNGKYVAIKGNEVLGIFDNYRQAADAIYVEHEYGTVLMQTISKDPDANTIVVYSPFAVPAR